LKERGKVLGLMKQANNSLQRTRPGRDFRSIIELPGR